MPRFGGRKPLTEAGAAVQTATRFPRELVAELKKMSEETGEPMSEIVRRGAENEVRKWRKRMRRPVPPGSRGERDD